LAEVDPYSRLAGVYDEIVVDPCFPSWATFLDDWWHADEQGVQSVLDVCCGTGLMAAELIKRGYRVVGVDASAEMLQRARALLGAGPTLSQQTLPSLDVDGVFDAAISTFDGLNYLTYHDFVGTLTVVAQHLRPGGWLVFDLHTDAMLALAQSNEVISGQDDGIGYAIVNDVDLAGRTCESRITVSLDDDEFSERHLQFFHTDRQVRDALIEAGLGLLAVVDEYSAAPVSADTLRATWIARRHGA
jgi:SAM-dependent methyltransferase